MLYTNQKQSVTTTKSIYRTNRKRNQKKNSTALNKVIDSPRSKEPFKILVLNRTILKNQQIK